MAAPRIFVSSTCYDLQEVRGNLRDFIYGFGYEPIMSDFGDIFYDFNTHVQESCVEAIKQSDMYVLIIGDNYGSTFHTSEKKQNEIPESVTLTEFKKALELEKAKIIFINKFVKHDYENYSNYLKEKYREYFNENTIEDKDINVEKHKIKVEVDKSYPFPKKSYKYIFYFLDKIYELKTNNAFFPFESSQDIKENLKKQWAGFLQERLKKREESNSFEKVEMKKMSDKLSKIERLLEDLNIQELLNTKKKLSEGTSGILSNSQFEEKQRMLYESLNNIFCYDEVDDWTEEISKAYRFKFMFTPSVEKITRWLDNLENLVKEYKWSLKIQSSKVFSGFFEGECKKGYNAEIDYKSILVLSELYKSLEEQEKQSFLIGIQLELSKMDIEFDDEFLESVNK